MLKVLINAYACSPNMGSEPGMAWNWCVNLANHCELHIVTEGEFRDHIEAVLPSLPHGKNMHFYYNPVSEKVRKMCWDQGNWWFYYYYRKWQKKTYTIALDIIANNHIDVIHQLNMIGFREPGFLWKINDIPFIWGPIDAKETFPVAYLKGLSQKQQLFIRLKNLITKLQLSYSFRVISAVNKAFYVVSASSESVKSFHKYLNLSSQLINETGCYPGIYSDFLKKRLEKETLDILWVGKLDARKQLTLAIKTIAKLKHIEKIKLHIIGGGDACQYQALADSLCISDKCYWYGAISHIEVQKIMQRSDLFFFTSVAEGTPHVVLEAINNCLPVVCFDCCGQGDSVNEKVGVKIKLSNPQQSENEFAEKLDYLYHHRELIDEMSQNCIQRQKELSWDHKATQMVVLYNQAIKKFKTNQR